MRAARHPFLRITLLVAGVVLILLSAVVAPIPGPGGIFFFAGGLVLVLQNSRRARVAFVRAKRRWPRVGNIVDRALRRPSARRRAERARLARAAEGAGRN